MFNRREETLIGIDVGATKIHIGTVQGLVVTGGVKIPTAASASEDQIVGEIIEGIEKLAGNNFKAIGIGVPGLVDMQKGIVYDLWNIPSWKEVFLKDHLENHFGKPVRVVNDANAFALGENKFGIGKRFKNFVTVSLGTGFGTGIIINNELYSGVLSGAGELANIPYLDKTIEDYCSGKFFKFHYGEKGAKVYEKAISGDPEAIKAYQEFGQHLGESLKLIMYAFSPEAIILGGSVSKSFSFFQESLELSLDTFPFTRIRNTVEVAPSKIKDVAILGPTALFGNLS